MNDAVSPETLRILIRPDTEADLTAESWILSRQHMLSRNGVKDLEILDAVPEKNRRVPSGKILQRLRYDSS